MSDDLAKRLRALHRCNMPACTDRHPCDGLDHVYRAARIGAEVEREACARICDEECDDLVGGPLAAEIRARGQR